MFSKKIFAVLIFLQLFLSPIGPAAETVTISIDDVVKKISNDNYEVLENALRVYQAKEAIQIARGNLLPRLNLWRIAGVAVDAVMGNYVGAAMGIIEDITPFLVPANWFALKRAKLLYLADKEAYRALWANLVMTSKGLYFNSLLDRAVLEHVNRNIQEFEELFRIVSIHEILGGLRDGASREIETRILALKEDRRALEVLILEETTLLAYMMGYPSEVEVKLGPIPLPDFSILEPLRYQDFEFRAVDSSPEIREFDHLIAASNFMRKEAMYTFLGSSGMNNGPAQSGGLGFGTGATMRVVAAQKETLKIQQRAATETLKRQLKLLVENYNLDIANYPDLKRHTVLTELTLRKLYERLSLGERIEMLMLVEASRNHIQSETSFFAVQYRFMANEDRLKRMLFQGNYTKEPAAIELIRGRL
ncbi:MAG: TolC family protein [Bdellovibrio sp.]|nr:TolC family protein [Bdellovibrio sp.]